MGLADLVSRRESATPGIIEYGRDGDWWRSAFTPWPGIMNDAITAPYVTEQQAEGLPGLGRGIELISGVISQLHPLLFKDAENPTRPTELLPTPQLLKNPDPYWHGLPEWLTALVASLFWNGDGFAYRGPEVCDYRGYPTRLPLLPADRFEWREGRYWVSSTAGQVGLDPGDVAHFVVGARAGNQFGLGILERYQVELNIMLATENSQFVVMKNGKPMGIISLGVDVNEDQAEQYKTAFLNAVSSTGVAAMGNADFKPVQWNSTELSMVPTREFNLRLASDISGVPPYLLGVPSESRVYANMETEWTTFIRVTLGRFLRAIESELSTCFPRGVTVRFDVDQLLRSDAAARWGVYATAKGLGAITVDEIRAAESLPPLTAKQKADLAPAPAPLAPSGASTRQNPQEESDNAD